MPERVVIVGAGIAGLCAALALAPSGREVVIMERDEAAPEGDIDTAFEDWNRRGVGHLRHSHAFLARLSLLLKAEHPALLDELAAAGCREIGFEASLSDIHKARYRPRPEDADFRILISRRTTLELVIRRYVERLPGVTLHSGVLASGLVTEGQSPVRVTGVETGSGRRFEADAVIEAGGKNAQLIEKLIEDGAPIGEEEETAGILYFTRHWRLNPGQEEPARSRKLRTTGDMGFLKYGVFPADNGCFSITLCTPEIELELRQAIVRPEIFDAICNQIPGTAAWIDPARATPISKVFGMGNLESRWRDMVTEGKPAVLGLFPLGDSLVRTNPLYGRGCSFAAAGAWLLREALDASPDPAARALAYHGAVHRELRPFFTTMRDEDRSAIRRARNALTPGYRPSLRTRMLKRFFEDGVGVAISSDPDLLREALRGFHMLEHPSAWLKRPVNLLKVLGYWMRGRKANAAAYPPEPGPGRAQMMQALGLDGQAAIDRVAQAA
jgi:2-polyprenyl-6-methoxyphenol hydroxylase-like FAD-dependent oxidoreductase